MINSAPAPGSQQTSRLDKHLAIALWALAIAFQLQLTPTLFGTGLRLSLADAISPAILGAVIWDTWRHRGLPLPRWRFPWLWLWLVAISAAITISLVVGRLEIGDWLAWAIVSKSFGWIVLLWYFLLAGWFIARFGIVGRRSFAVALVTACTAIASLDLTVRAARLAFIDFPKALPFGALRLQGLMENPNAFAYLAGIALLLWLCLETRDKRWRFYGVATVLVAAQIMAASRGLWLAWLLLAVFLLCLQRHRLVLFRPLIVAVPLAIALVALISAMPTFMRVLDQEITGGSYPGDTSIIVQLPSVTSPARLALRDSDYDYRVTSNLIALQMWWDRPLTGQGLGSYRWSQGTGVRSDGFRHAIHNSILWILAEMGLIGAIPFLGFFLLCLRALWPGRRSGNQDDSDPTLVASFLMLVLFAGMSLSTEILYQRHFWFILGMALAVAPRQQSEPAASR